MIALLLFAALVHPVHETLAEVEWNAKSKRFEVALRLHQLDEQWLKKRYGRRTGKQSWAIEYVSDHIRIASPPKKGEADPTKYHWIGRQVSGAHVWWYFEIETKEGHPPDWIEQRVLFERRSDYTNRVLILNENPKRSLSLTAKRPRGTIQPEKEATAKP